MKKFLAYKAVKSSFGSLYKPAEKDWHGLLPEQISQLNPVVSYDDEGQPRSYFNEDHWDFSAYADKSTNRVKAKYIVTFKGSRHLKKSLLKELKVLVLYYFYNTYPQRVNAACGVCFYERISKFFLYLNKINQKSINYLGESIHFFEMLRALGPKYSFDTFNASLNQLKALHSYEVPTIEFQLPVERGRLLSSTPTKSICQLAKEHCNQSRIIHEQTLYIPYHVQERMINHAYELVIEAEGRINDIIGFFEEHFEVHRISEEIEASEPATNRRTQKKKEERRSSIRRHPSKAHRLKGIVTRKELLAKYNLTDLDDQYAATGKGVLYYTRLMAASAYVILASFSGMREDEILALKHGAYGTVGSKERQIYFLRTYESKLTGGKYLDYVTSPIAERALKLMIKLHGPAKRLIPELRNVPFVFLSFPINRLPMYGVSGLAETLPHFIKHFDIRMTTEDMDDFKMHNQRTNKEVKIGELWPIATHQFRRSLIINFLTHRSLGVTQVKQQVKHLYGNMTEYYGGEYDLPKLLELSRSDDFIQALNEENVSLQIVLYKRFFMSDERLGGEKGKEVEQMRKKAKHLTYEEIRLLI